MIDFEQLADNLNIPVLRKSKHTAWLYKLVGQLKLVQSWWTNRLDGSSYAMFNSTNDYTIYDYVRYGRASYICKETPPVGLYPLPTNETYWYKILDDYIGLNERSKYSSQKVMLEFALNRRFSPLTITPPFGPSANSIYIENNLINKTPILWSAPAGTNTQSWTAPNSSVNFWYSTYGNPLINITSYNFTVYVPSAIHSSIDSNPVEANYIISQEIDIYNTAGMLYEIQTY